MNNQSHINFNDVSLKFRLYTDKGVSIKEAVISRIKNSKNSNNVKEFWVLKNINLTINNGERVGIIGNNGAGKSTLLKLISQIYRPTLGEVEIKGKVVPLIELGAGFNPELTGRENIYLNGAVLGYTKKEMSLIEQNIIDFSELGDFIDVPIKYYSTGMYGRLAFTVATEMNPEILIIDEIFAGGDINFIEKATERMNQLIDSAKIVIVVSHSMELIRKMCNRCIVIENHRIAFDGSSEEAITEYVKLCKI